MAYVPKYEEEFKKNLVALHNNGKSQAELCVLCQTKMAKNFIVFPEKFQISGLLTEETLFSA